MILLWIEVPNILMEPIYNFYILIIHFFTRKSLERIPRIKRGLDVFNLVLYKTRYT